MTFIKRKKKRNVRIVWGMNLLLITHFITIISMYVIYGWVWGGEFKIPNFLPPPPPPQKKEQLSKK